MAQWGTSGRQGAALLVICDIPAAEEPAFQEWYNREHMRDRILGLPGFRRGRRYAALNGSPKYLALYEAEDDSVFRSEAYVTLINTPDPKSRHFITRFQNTIRTIGRITASFGEGEGSVLGVLPLSNEAGRTRQDVEEVLPSLAAEAGIIAGHLLERDAEALSVSATRHVRQGDRTLDAALLVEASDQETLNAVGRKLLAPRLLKQPSGDAFMTYRLLYRVSP